MSNILALPRPKPATFDPLQIGVESWERIKTSSKMLREDWRIVGLDLLEGRKANPSNIAFGQWCKAEGYGDMDRRLRADAMWLAQNWDAIGIEYSNGLSHPQAIRQAYNAHLAGTVEPEETDEPEAAPAQAAPATAAPTPAPATQIWGCQNHLCTVTCSRPYPDTVTSGRHRGEPVCQHRLAGYRCDSLASVKGPGTATGGPSETRSSSPHRGDLSARYAASMKTSAAASMVAVRSTAMVIRGTSLP